MRPARGFAGRAPDDRAVHCGSLRLFGHISRIRKNFRLRCLRARLPPSQVRQAIKSYIEFVVLANFPELAYDREAAA